MGFWSSYGTAAAVDWCEPNYVYSPFIAEWWNSLSSIVIAAIALWGIVGWWKTPRREGRFFWGFLGLAIVGIGSMAFHGTLLKLPQASDELPMVYCGLIFAYTVLRRNDQPGDAAGETRGRRWRWALGGYGAIVTIAYFSMAAYFHFFLIVYAVLVTYLCVSCIRIAFRIDRRPVMRRLLGWSVGSYLGGFFFLWVPEHFLLACNHPLQSLQLHAWFHLTSAVGSYAWVVFMMMHRAHVLGDATTWSDVVWPSQRAQTLPNTPSAC